MKQKTRKSLARRVKITKTGKLLRRTQNMRHLRRRKSKSQIRRMKQTRTITGTNAKKVKRMLGEK